MSIEQIRNQHAAKLAGLFECMNEADVKYQKRWDEYQAFCDEPGGVAVNADLSDPYSAASKKAEADKAKKKGRHDS